MKIFSFVKKKDIDRVAECGINSEEYCAFSAFVNGAERQCILGYITPYDSDLINNGDFVPVKVNLKNENVIVAEGVFREQGLDVFYAESFVRLSDYRFGSFRKPECLIPGTVLPEEIEKYNPKMDEPLLYTYSEELYVDSAFAKAADEIQNFKELSVKGLFEKNEKDGTGDHFTKDGYIFFRENGKIVFISKEEKTN